jgi:hypothetical protein
LGKLLNKLSSEKPVSLTLKSGQAFCVIHPAINTFRKPMLHQAYSWNKKLLQKFEDGDFFRVEMNLANQNQLKW